MKNKKESKRIYIYLYILTIIIIAIIKMLPLETLTFKNIILSLLDAIITTLPVILLILVVFLGMIKGAKKAVKENLSQVDFKNNKEYYRDILKKYTPAELSYIDNFEINLNKNIIATLLILELKKKIEIKNSIISIVNNETNDLSKTELLILNRIKDGKVIIYNQDEIEDTIIEETLNDELIVKNTVSKKEKEKIIFDLFIAPPIILLTVIILISILGENIMNFLNNIIFSIENTFIPLISILILIFILPLIGPFRFFSKLYYIEAKSKIYKRTELGEEINLKIEGLKNYLNNFSTLDKKAKEELTLWEEYLVYSVLFDINNKIVDELQPLIKIDK